MTLRKVIAMYSGNHVKKQTNERTNEQTNEQNKQIRWWANADFIALSVAVHTGYWAQSLNVSKIHPRTVYEGSEGGGD